MTIGTKDDGRRLRVSGGTGGSLEGRKTRVDTGRCRMGVGFVVVCFLHCHRPQLSVCLIRFRHSFPSSQFLFVELLLVYFNR